MISRDEVVEYISQLDHNQRDHLICDAIDMQRARIKDKRRTHDLYPGFFDKDVLVPVYQETSKQCFVDDAEKLGLVDVVAVGDVRISTAPLKVGETFDYIQLCSDKELCDSGIADTSDSVNTKSIEIRSVCVKDSNGKLSTVDRSHLEVIPIQRFTEGRYGRWTFVGIDCLVDLGAVCEIETEKLKLTISIDELGKVRKSDSEQDLNGFSVVGYSMVAKRFKRLTSGRR